MGLGIFTTPKTMGGQILLRDDHTFLYRELPMVMDAIVEPDNQEDSRGWWWYHKLAKEFRTGYKNIKRGVVLLCTTRDSVLDTQNILKDNEKPEKGPSLKKNFVSIRASAICYKHEKNAKPQIIADKIVIFLGSLMIILGIAVALVAAL